MESVELAEERAEEMGQQLVGLSRPFEGRYGSTLNDHAGREARIEGLALFLGKEKCEIRSRFLDGGHNCHLLFLFPQFLHRGKMNTNSLWISVMNLNLQIKLTNVHFAALKMFSRCFPTL